MPSLILAPPPISKDSPDKEELEAEFWNSLRSDYTDEDVPPIIIQALKGQSQSWKFVRCCPTCGGFIFVVANPEIIALNRSHIEHGRGLDNDMKHGLVWTWFTTTEMRFDVIEQRRKKDGRLKRRAKYSFLLEYKDLFVEYFYCFACSKKATYLIEATRKEDNGINEETGVATYSVFLEESRLL